MLSQFEEALVTGYQNTDKQDLSMLIRGRIITLKEVLEMDKAIDAYEDLKEMVEKNTKGQKPELVGTGSSGKGAL